MGFGLDLQPFGLVCKYIFLFSLRQLFL